MFVARLIEDRRADIDVNITEFQEMRNELERIGRRTRKLSPTDCKPDDIDGSESETLVVMGGRPLSPRIMQRVPRWVWAFAGLDVAFVLATTRFEQTRDELYFISASKRLAFSYVDFQPMTPFLVRIERSVFGESLVGLRVIPALAGGAGIVLAALIVREFGGDRRAQVIAAFALLVIPAFVGADSALNTVSLEIPAYMLIALVFARIVRTRNDRLYLALGVAAGAALLVKFTMAAYLIGVGAAIITTPLRQHLRSAWLWAGAVLGGAIVAPSVVWQVTHHLAALEFVSHQGAGGAVLGLRGRAGYFVALILFPGPLALPLTISGTRKLATDERLRPVGVAVLIPVLGFLAVSGKGYYAFPAIAVVCCAGALALAGWTTRARRNIIIALLINLLIPLPLLTQLVPTSVLHYEGIARATEISERIGWRELARQIGRVTAALPKEDRDRAVFIGSNYTLPSAVEFYRDAYPVPRIAVSGQNSAYLWWPDFPDDYVAIMVGFDDKRLTRLYDQVLHVGTVTNREGVHGTEWGDDISVARGPKLSQDRLRAALKKFTA